MKKILTLILGMILYINYRLAYLPLLTREILSPIQFANQRKEENINQIAWVLIFDFALIGIFTIGTIWTLSVYLLILLINIIYSYAFRKTI